MGLKLKEAYEENALAVFVKVSSEEEIQRRLGWTGHRNEKSLATRLAKVRYELSFEHEFDTVLVNDNLEDALRSENLIEEFIRPENNSCHEFVSFCHFCHEIFFKIVYSPLSAKFQIYEDWSVFRIL